MPPLPLKVRVDLETSFIHNSTMLVSEFDTVENGENRTTKGNNTESIR